MRAQKIYLMTFVYIHCYIHYIMDLMTLQDTALSSTETISHTAKTTVIVIIVDINNRPPWFQPCTEFDNGATRICLSSGYTGNVKLNEQTVCSNPLISPLTLVMLLAAIHNEELLDNQNI